MSISRPTLAFALIAGATVTGIAGTDLILPAVPMLPGVLGGNAAQAQLVLAAFTAGAALGLLAFGELGARHDPRRLLVASLLAYALAGFACAASRELPVLIALRFAQGAAGAAAAVFAPGMIRALHGEQDAVRALGALGSIEAMAPALAPLAGAWLLARFGWRAGFLTLGMVALMLAAAMLRWPHLLPRPAARPRTGSYARLLRNRALIGHALGYAGTLGGLLVFVFGVPAVFERTLGLGIGAFVTLQICGILCFAVTANLTGRIVRAIGAARAIVTGSLMSAAGAFALFAYALAGGARLAVIVALFAIVNAGLGVRGAPGFHAAIVAAGADDARAAALVVLAVLATASGGTALTAPWIDGGLPVIAGAALTLILGGLAALALVPRGE